MNRRLPKWCSEFTDRHGRPRVRFRRAGQKTYYFRSVPWTSAFMAEYQACLDRTIAPKLEPGLRRTMQGTFSALIALYYRSPEFTGLAPGTTPGYRSSIERFRIAHGDKRVVLMGRRHIKAILGGMSSTPGAANNLYDRLRTLMALTVEEGFRRDNPMLGMKAPFRIKSEGYYTWTEEEIAHFEARHPIDSMARLAMGLMLFTGQRRSDVVTIGWQHVTQGRIKVRQQKTTKLLEIPVHSELWKVLEAAPRDNLTFLMTTRGEPFTPAGLGNWFRQRCDEAGLGRCSAHGLRKAAARRMAEAGCTNAQIKAVTGHRTDAEVSRYVREAEQVGLAEQAIGLVERAKSGTTIGYPHKQVSQNEG